MKVVVLGANGQLGSDLVAEFDAAGHEVVSLTHQNLAVEDLESTRRALETARPDIVLNTAAFHNVPQCESEPAQAFAVNAVGTSNVAQLCAELGAVHVYYSTDYVFDGLSEQPYREDDLPRPLNVYAASKLAGEHLAGKYDRSLVVRISGIYGRVPCRAKGGHFISTMVRLAREKPEVRVVTDEILTPTPTLVIARHTLQLLEAGIYGTFHLTCEGSCSWYEFAREIFARLSLGTPLLPAKVSDFPSPVQRPHYSVLDNRRMREAELEPLPHWRPALHEFLETYLATA